MAGGHSATAQMISDTLSNSRRSPKSAKNSTLGVNPRTNKAVSSVPQRMSARQIESIRVLC
jgi:hypothetical protein